tara:strand:- start:101 stop:1735 length:1635 start_codon:yes stop_codon:yes gene_type:complete
MADSSDKSSQPNESLDLEQLRDLSFAPQWSSGVGSSSSTPRRSRDDKPKARPSGGARDRRPARKRPAPGGGADRGRSYERPQRSEPYQPIVQFSIYPEDEPFDLLTQSIRSSLKVYELFEITRLILDKSDRMVVVVSPLSDESPPLYECLPDRQLFRDESAALLHSANLLLPTIFEEKEEEVEPPSGNFTSVLRCGTTGKYLPPRSYHRFQALLQEHHRLNCPDVPFARVEKGLESVADAEAIQAWLQSMSRRSVFRERKAGEPIAEKPAKPEPSPEAAPVAGSEEAPAPAEAGVVAPAADSAEEGPAAAEPTPAPAPAAEKGLVFDSREATLNHLIRTMREKLVRETRQARVPAKSLVEAEDSEIRKSFEAYVEQQKRFPLDSANNVRMKLRKGKFFIFKKGKKGISFVSAVRRKARPQGAIFADSVSKVIQVLEASPDLHLKELPAKRYPEKVDASGKADLSPEEKVQFVQDLKWLKSEGYLYEYSDGVLELHPVESVQPPKVAKPAAAPAAPAKDSEQVKASEGQASEGQKDPAAPETEGA